MRKTRTFAESSRRPGPLMKFVLRGVRVANGRLCMMALAAATAVTLAAIPAALGEEPHSLKALFFKGRVYSVQQVYGYRLNVSAENDLGLPLGRAENERVERYEEEILELDGGRPVKVRRKYDAAIETLRDAVTGEQTILFPYKGKRVIAERRKDGGAILKDQDGNDLGAYAETIGMFYEYRNFLPEGPVMVGDRWAVDPESRVENGEKSPWMHASGKIYGELKALKPCRNSSCAVVGIKMKAAYAISETTGVDVDLQGEMVFSIEGGYPAFIQLEGPAVFHDDPSRKTPLTRKEFAKGDFYYQLEEKM